jgi:peroxiredoxin
VFLIQWIFQTKRKKMKRIIASLAIIGLASAAFAAAEVGKPAPDFSGTDINGKTIKLSDYKGKIVVLESYNNDCPFCHNHFATGAMQELQKEMTSKGVIWLMVNSVNPHNSSHRTPEQARAEWQKEKINATAWIDDSSGTIGHLYGMRTTPDMFVIDQGGTLVYAGAIDDKPTPNHDPRKARNYVREAIQKIEAGQKADVSETKPYGCAVKYGG